jgi:hypothetical protein
MQNITVQDGGNIINDVKHLAIPFGLLLAKNGIEYLMGKSESATGKTKTVVKPKKKSSAPKPKPKQNIRKRQSGGNQDSNERAAQGPPGPVQGGAKYDHMVSSLVNLRNEISGLLDNYNRK